MELLKYFWGLSTPYIQLETYKVFAFTITSSDTLRY